ADLHLLGERAEVRIARRELGVRVADADDGAAIELVVGYAAILHPRAVDEAHLAFAAEPFLAAAALAGCHRGDSPQSGEGNDATPRRSSGKANSTGMLS